jgi:hypothetical protein
MSVIVTPPADSVIAGATRQFSVTLADTKGNSLSGRPIVWSSTKPGVALVTQSGVVTGIAPGSATIVATSDGMSGSAPIRVLAPVARVSVSPGSARIEPHTSQRFTATLLAANGDTLTGRPVVWSSATTTAALVSASTGDVTGLAEGTSTITATVENKSGSVGITVTVEPVGMTVITDRPFNCMLVVGCESDWNWFGNAQPTIVSDETAPKSPPSVARITYSAGFVGGSGQGQTCRLSLGKRTIYMSAWLQLSANFEGHPTGANKLFYIATNNDQTFLLPEAEGTYTGPLYPRFVLQNLAGPYQDQGGVFATTIGRLQNVSTGVQIVRGRWHRFEYVLVNNTPGVADGSIDAWQDGVKTFHVPGIMFVPADANGNRANWGSVCWQPIWGGEGGLALNTFFMELDHLYISGK